MVGLHELVYITLLKLGADYKRTQKAMASCSFCFGDDDSPPKAPVIAMGTRVYLSCTVNEELVNGHCLIVPIQHHLSMLEGDDDVWDEVRVRALHAPLDRSTLMSFRTS